MQTSCKGEFLELFNEYREVAKRIVNPTSLQHDREHRFNRDAWEEVAQSGLFGLHIPTEFGGAGKTFEHFIAALEGFATGCEDIPFTLSVIAHAGVFQGALLEFASASLKKTYLSRTVSGKSIGAVANTEPGSGTDVLSLQMGAIQTDEGYSLTGQKWSITNIGQADLILVSAKLREVDHLKRINVFLVENSSKGLKTELCSDLLGFRTSSTGDLKFENVNIPFFHLLGEMGTGVPFFKYCFAMERFLIGVLCLGAARQILDRMIQFIREKEEAGRPLGEHQYIQGKIVEAAMTVDLLQSQLKSLREKVLSGEECSFSLSSMRLFSMEKLLQMSEDLIRLIGSKGYRQGSGVEKYWRDLMGLTMLGGTAELHKIIVYQEVLRKKDQKISKIFESKQKR